MQEQPIISDINLNKDKSFQPGVLSNEPHANLLPGNISIAT